MTTKTVSRREFLKLAGATGLLATLPRALSNVHALSSTAKDWMATGLEVPELASFDTAMQDFMQARNISGGSLAVTRNSELVFARGYTYSDDAEDIVVEPTSLFRIASISKPITATAVIRLMQDNQLDLSAKLTDILTLPSPADPRLVDVTVLNLLQHLGGWDRGIAGDPMFRDRTIANLFALPLPISKADIVTYMTGRSLQHTPGTVFAYSNYGFSLLGLIIEAVTGQSYTDYIKENVFAPLIVTQPQMGRTLPAYRLPEEVKYHSQYTGRTVFDGSGTQVPSPYGAWNLDNMDSHGGWLMSAVDLIRFASTFDYPTSSPVLSPASMDILFGLPENKDPATYTPGTWYYACGWWVRDHGGGLLDTEHNGGLAGTSTLIVRRQDGVNWCVLFNQRDDPSGLSYGTIASQLHDAVSAISEWPDHDLFGEYYLQKVYLPLIIN